MKASELRSKLDVLIQTEGDPEVGVEDAEYQGTYRSIGVVTGRDSSCGKSIWNDDPDLGARFIAISIL